jgi:hypothetical protein
MARRTIYSVDFPEKTFVENKHRVYSRKTEWRVNDKSFHKQAGKKKYSERCTCDNQPYDCALRMILV